ncbi:MAG: aldo/keto reductase [Firmicutes bacterium]|nr:aldo/keto reductase [Bacillota bacterium]
MNYRKDRQGRDISILGYGCMRFTKTAGIIDLAKAEREVMRAIEGGVNYFDTAYIYPGSEDALGRILERNKVRDKVYIATKLPQYLMRNINTVEKIFNEELKRLRTDHIDYYLMHMLADIREWNKLKDLGIEDWIREKKDSGQIGSVGFSYHGDTEDFIEILDAYDWDFAQIQYNYLDEESQAGRRGLMACADRGIPVIIMEPLRGGRLANLPKAAARPLRESGLGWSAAELALRWLWDQPQVTCVLSGMNSFEMIDENMRIASSVEAGSFGEREKQVTREIISVIRAKEKVGCTGCRYCMPCPQGVDIPGNFFYYNQVYTDGRIPAMSDFAKSMGMHKTPGFASLCIGCGKCEKHCPQHIHIIEELKKADRTLRPLPYRVGLAVVRKVMGR